MNSAQKLFLVTVGRTKIMRVVGAKKLIDLDLAIFNGYLISLILYRLTDRQAGVMKNYCYGFF